MEGAATNQRGSHFSLRPHYRDQVPRVKSQPRRIETPLKFEVKLVLNWRLSNLKIIHFDKLDKDAW